MRLSCFEVVGLFYLVCLSAGNILAHLFDLVSRALRALEGFELTGIMF